MKLKLVVNGCEAPEDYRLLKTTVSTVASLRKTAVLRFTSERLVIISTPKSSSSNSGTILQADSGQLWCTIPQDLFKLYTVISARELNTITMEYNCDSLLSVFKRYDRVMNQGSSSNMTIKLQSMPEWNAGSNDSTHNSDAASKLNPVCALGITFEEIVRTQGTNDNANYGAGSTNGSSTTTVMGGFGSNKIVMHSFKVPVKLLFKAQDQRIQEPMINYTHLMMCKLPPISGEYGAGFHSFIKRVERYTNVSHIKLSGLRNDDTIENESDKLKIIVNELDWHLEICWNGPLDSVVQQGIQTQASQQVDEATGVPSPSHTSKSHERTTYEEDSMRVEDSEIMDKTSTTVSGVVDVELVDVSAMVERAEQETSKIHEVVIRCKDWKVCDKLYGAFEEVVLAISHNESCVLHCSLDRGNFEEGDAVDKPKERGQIIYYMARSKPL